MEKIQMLKLFDQFYTQKSAAKTLEVSRNTIVNDERNIRESSINWMDSMSSGDFVNHIRNWFVMNTIRINDFNDKINNLAKVTPKEHDTLMRILNPLLQELDEKEAKIVLKILIMYGDESKAEGQAADATLYQNTITNMIRLNKELVQDYPLVRTAIEYKAYLNSKEPDDNLDLSFMKMDNLPDVKED